MLLVGIDEAGYGPTLGPLCHARSVFRLPDALADTDLWERLHPVVSRVPASKGVIEVDDSKRVYAGSNKFERLRRPVAAFARCLPKTRAKAKEICLLERLLSPEDVTRRAGEPWEEALHRQDAVPRNNEAKALSAHLAAQGIKLLDLRVRAMDVRRFNEALGRLDNKSDVAWEQVRGLLREALDLGRAGEEIRFIVDRQGGRKFYAGQVGELLGMVLPGVEEESARRSAYRCEVEGRRLRFEFTQKAETSALPVALASMAAKWVRELFMERLNAFFCGLEPALKPTAGYPTDAARFLHETEALRLRLGIPDEALIRQR